MAITLNGTSGITAPTYNGTVTAEYSVPVTGFKNRIINGAMMIDQRNAGAAVTVNSASDFYPVDRFSAFRDAGNTVFTLQRSTVVPSGFINSVKLTVTTAETTVDATDLSAFRQIVEGFNVADLGWGTANAQSVTLGFWVRSSLTGTFGGALKNNNGSRSYPFTYTISVADTWEFKAITIAGDTSGTWITDNGRGVQVVWGICGGSSRIGTAEAWSSSDTWGATGQTQIASTLNATFYITGVQLEKGSTATSFDYRPYGTELALCQRYYEILTSPSGTNGIVSWTYSGGGSTWAFWQFKTTKRASATVSLLSGTWGGGTPTTIVASQDMATFTSASINIVTSGVLQAIAEL